MANEFDVQLLGLLSKCCEKLACEGILIFFVRKNLRYIFSPFDVFAEKCRCDFALKKDTNLVRKLPNGNFFRFFGNFRIRS